MQIHGAHTRTGKVIRDGLLIIINIEIIKGTTHAHPDILRPKMGNSITLATNVDPITIHTTKGTSNFLIFITLKLITLILKYLQ